MTSKTAAKPLPTPVSADTSKGLFNKVPVEAAPIKSKYGVPDPSKPLIPNTPKTTQPNTGKSSYEMYSVTTLALSPQQEEGLKDAKEHMDGKTWGIWKPEDVIRLIKDCPQRTYILDVRGRSDAEECMEKLRKFKNAKRLAPPLAPKFDVALLQSTLNKLIADQTEWNKLLAADYVVVHCYLCSIRSPFMMTALYNTLEKSSGHVAGRKAGQKVGLMAHGFAAVLEGKHGSTAVVNSVTESIPLEKTALNQGKAK